MAKGSKVKMCSGEESLSLGSDHGLSKSLPAKYVELA